MRSHHLLVAADMQVLALTGSGRPPRLLLAPPIDEVDHDLWLKNLLALSDALLAALLLVVSCCWWCGFCCRCILTVVTSQRLHKTLTGVTRCLVLGRRALQLINFQSNKVSKGRWEGKRLDSLRTHLHSLSKWLTSLRIVWNHSFVLGPDGIPEEVWLRKWASKSRKVTRGQGLKISGHSQHHGDAAWSLSQGSQMSNRFCFCLRYHRKSQISDCNQISGFQLGGYLQTYWKIKRWSFEETFRFDHFLVNFSYDHEERSEKYPSHSSLAGIEWKKLH